MKYKYNKRLTEAFPNSGRSKGITTFLVSEESLGVSLKSMLEAYCTVCEAVVETTGENLLKGRKPCKCSHSYYNTPERKEERISEVSKIKGIFRTSSEEILSCDQGFNVECSTCFYSWDVHSYSYFCNTGRGCPDCAGQRRYTDEEYITRINQVGSVNKFMFHSKCIKGKLRNQSRVNLKCLTCLGIWDSLITNTLSGKYSCPNCARHGHNPLKATHLYIMKIDSLEYGVYYKYGISNSIKKRGKNLRAYNQGSRIELAASWLFMDGMFGRDVERLIKDRFGTYATKEMLPDGFTETIKESDLFELFQYIQDAYSTYKSFYHSGVQSGGSNTDPF